MGREFWLLDAYEGAEGLVVKLYSESEMNFCEKRLKVPFHGYLVVNDPERIVWELKESGLVNDAWVEKWFIPPLYRVRVEIVVFRTYRLSDLRYVLKKCSTRGLKYVNDFPNPIVEALFHIGLQPLTKLVVDGDDVRSLEWNPTNLDPPLDVIRIYVEGSHYVLELNNSKTYFVDIRELAEYLVSLRYHIGITDKDLYLKLLEEEPSIASSTHLWITGGSYRAAEYFEWCRHSYIPLSLMSNVSIGRIITTMEALEARRRKYVIDRSTRRVENFRNMANLLLYDRGGIIYRPKPGLYWNVCQVDFKSLYPNIIARFNISSETVDVPICNNLLRPEWTRHTLCMDVEGIVPKTIAKLIKLKSFYEELYRSTGLEIYDVRRSACKWVLVASFGYLGYRNSLFGSISAHEVVTSTSRYLMSIARNVVNSMGYRVVHALVDSLFVDGVTTVSECSEICEAVSRATGFETKVDSHYVWLYIPTSVKDSHGVANRYYGKLSAGGVKLRGISCVRTDTPAFVKEAQLRAISELARANTKTEMIDAIRRAHNILEEYRRRLLNQEVGIDEILVMRRSPLRRREYIRPPKQVLEGKPPYLYVKYYIHSGYVSRLQKTNIDLSYYLRLLERASAELPGTSSITD